MKVRPIFAWYDLWVGVFICWCTPTSPCHATVIADAAMQAQAAAEIRRRGLALPAKHWSAYKRPTDLSRKTA